MKLSRTVAAMAVMATVGGPTAKAWPLGRAGATSGRQDEVATPSTGAPAGCHPALAVVASVLGLRADEVRAGLDEGRTLAQLAEAQGVDRRAVIDALAAAARDRIEARVGRGELTRDQADRRVGRLAARAAGVVDAPLARARRDRTLREAQRLATLVGLTTRELREAQASGRSLAEIATANGIDPQAVIDALVARSTERVTRIVYGESGGDR